jgi:hypothetical protein
VSGLRIKIFVNEDMASGVAYNISVFTMRNPERFDASVYKWILEVSDFDSTIIVYRSFATNY